MTNDRRLERVAELLRERNRIDDEIASVIGRPPSVGHLGEYIAATIFGITLAGSAAARAIDGRFTSGPLAARTVNIKCYARQEGVLDLQSSEPFPDFYLVLAGPTSPAASSRGRTRPFRIAAVYLFDTTRLRAALIERGLTFGVATSVAGYLWSEAEIFPEQHSELLLLTDEQRHRLELFA